MICSEYCNKLLSHNIEEIYPEGDGGIFISSGVLTNVRYNGCEVRYITMGVNCAISLCGLLYQWAPMCGIVVVRYNGVEWSYLLHRSDRLDEY